MQLSKAFTAIIIILPLLSGCKSTVNTFDYSSLCSPLLATGSGALTYELLEDESDGLKYGLTFGAAAGTYVTSELVRYKVFQDFKDQSQKGYALGLIDGCQHQKNILRNMRYNDQQCHRARERVFHLPGVKQADGINYAPHQVTIKLLE